MKRCYYCGNLANDADDHIPPEVLYNGACRSYKKPPVISFPSCKAHNSDLSVDDYEFALCISGMAGPGNNALQDVKSHLLNNISKIAMANPFEVDRNLEMWGIRLARKNSDYYSADDCISDDLVGTVKPIVYDQKHFEEMTIKMKRRIKFISDYAKRIAAGMHYKTSGGRILGEEGVEKISVLWPGLRQIDTGGNFTEDNYDIEKLAIKIFGKYGKTSTHKVESGSPDVFRCSHKISKDIPTNFISELTFYGTVFCVCYIKVCHRN